MDNDYDLLEKMLEVSAEHEAKITELEAKLKNRKNYLQSF